MTVSSIGEFALIARISAVLGAPTESALLIGIGDDAAAWVPAPGALATATADTLVEGVHFDLRTTSWTDLGWKALAENLSDIAAMGCQPRYALVGLGVPPTTAIMDVEALYAGMKECTDLFGCAVVGGDTVTSPVVTIHVAVLGESLLVEGDSRPLLLRSSAVPGDVLAVTGLVGASAAGLRLLQAGGANVDDPLVLAHVRPQPRVTAGIALIQAGVRCAIDISDGLVADVGHICERSNVDAEIEAPWIPLHPEARLRFGDEALELGLSGGEDYELACTCSEEAFAAANVRLLAQDEPPLARIGRIVTQRGATPEVRLRGADGQPVAVGVGGYQHFGGQP